VTEDVTRDLQRDASLAKTDGKNLKKKDAQIRTSALETFVMRTNIASIFQEALNVKVNEL
jgi:hypothetical protein